MTGGAQPLPAALGEETGAASVGARCDHDDHITHNDHDDHDDQEDHNERDSHSDHVDGSVNMDA